MSLPLYKRLWALPKTATHIVVPFGYEHELRMEACVQTRTAYKDVLFGRDVIWVETLGL